MHPKLRVGLILLILFLQLNIGGAAQAKAISRQQAVRAAERFIIDNGYTDLPSSTDKSKVVFESIEWGANRQEILKRRHNTLERKAYAYLEHGKGKPGWTIAFRYKNKKSGKNEIGRAVTMDLDGKRKFMQHVGIILSRCKKL